MTRKVGGNLLNSQFGEIGVHQQLNEANQQINSLTQEIEQLKAQGKKKSARQKGKELRAVLDNQGILQIPLSQIKQNPEQPRQTFSQQSINQLACSIERDGQQEPILVFKKDDQSYLLFDGERRWRAIKQLDWENIDAIIVPKRDSENLEQPESIRRRALLANHHREDINPLDLAEALVKEISVKEGISEEIIPRILSTAIVRLNRQDKLETIIKLVIAGKNEQEKSLNDLSKKQLIRGDEEKILKFLLSLQLNPHSVKNNIFPALKLFDDLKIAIRTMDLGGHHARVLQRITPEVTGQSLSKTQNIRQRLIKKVIEEKLSISATRQCVAQLIAKNNSKPILSPETQGIIRNLEKLDPSSLESDNLKILEKQLSAKLKDIRRILRNQTN